MEVGGIKGVGVVHGWVGGSRLRKVRGLGDRDRGVVDREQRTENREQRTENREEERKSKNFVVLDILPRVMAVDPSADV